MESISPRIIARVAALFFLAAALGTLVPGPSGTSYGAQLGLTLSSVAIATGAWFLPWSNWQPGATLWLAPLAFVELAAAVLVRAYNPLTFSCYYVVVFVWLGVGFRQWTSLKFMPLAAAAYILPIARTSGLGDALTAVEVVPVSVVVGESLAWVSHRLRQAEALDIARVAELRQLLAAAEQLARHSDARQAPELVAALGGKLLRADGSAFVVVEDDGSWTPTTAWGEWITQEGEPLLLPPLPLAAVPFTGVQLQSEPVRRFPPAAVPPGPFAELAAGGTLLLVALAGLGPPRGVLLGRQSAARRAKQPWGHFEEQLAAAFGKQAGLMLERVEALEGLRRESLRDALTGLGNRRLAERLLRELKSGDALVAIDLDHFKQLNDSEGHAAGDEVLRRFGEDLRSSLRDSDAAVRLGGDEFLLLLKSAGNAGARAVVDRMRATWSGHERRVGFSAGIALHMPGEDSEQTLRRADAALYAAKHAGRGQTL